MTKSKKLGLLALLACFALFFGLAFGLLSTRAVLAAEEFDRNEFSDDYFGKQLETPAQKAFYKAMEEMNEKGVFKRGEDYDLVANGYVTQAQLAEYANGSTVLVDDMGAARDAFYTDYAEIFYVDFGYLSLRVTQETDGTYHAWLGKGRADTYYVNGFTGEADVTKAIAEYDKKITAVVDAAKAAKPTDAQKAAFGETLATTVAQIREAHKLIALSTVYRLEDNCTPGNDGHIRTPYGLLVKGEALCEGYSRTFKAAMDRLGVPCVLVNGVYRHSENRQELHMWTHIQLKVNGNLEWYAVDQTFDDLNLKNPVSGIPYTEFGKAYNEDYFLKGAAFMDMQHATSSFKSEAEYPFEYPQLAPHNFGSEVSTAHRGGIIRVEQYPYDLGAESSTIEVSVYIEDENGDGDWYGYVEAAKRGYYIVQRHEGHYLPEQILRASQGDLSDPSYNLEEAEYNLSMVWAYLSPFKENEDGTIESLYGSVKESESGDRSIITDYSKQTGFEFAVTDVAPRPLADTNDRDKAAEMTTYSGDPTTFIARTGLIHTLYGDSNYYPAPHIVKASPVLTGKLAIGYTYNVTVEYDQWLELMNGDEEIKMSVVGVRATGEILKGTNALVLEDVVEEGSLTWDAGEGNRGGSISFTFTPSKMYAHDNVLYYFNFNLQGQNSKKQVNPITHVGAYESDACCYKANGFHWRVWAQPQLLENDDLSTEGWVTSDGTDVSQTSSRFALVVNSPSKKQDAQINDLLEKTIGGKDLKAHDTEKDNEDTQKGKIEEGEFQSFTYNISLTICKGVVLETYQGIRVCIGFPEGFTYDMSMNGVTFKAYHFIHDAQNNVTGVEELEVVVTELGLIITCYSFSPFAIVAVNTEDLPEEDRPQATTDKTVIITASNGGSAYADVSETAYAATSGKTRTNLFKLAEGETSRLTVKSNAGYIIESVELAGKLYYANSDKMELDLAYDAFTGNESLHYIKVNFVARSVKASEAARGETAVVQKDEASVVQSLKGADITVNGENVSVKVGEKIELKATYTTYAEENTYQWYKDGVAIEGATSGTYVIESAALTDSGVYTFEVRSTADAVTLSAVSNAIHVNVTSGLSGLAIGLIVLGSVVVVSIASVVVVLLKTRKKKA